MRRLALTLISDHPTTHFVGQLLSFMRARAAVAISFTIVLLVAAT